MADPLQALSTALAAPADSAQQGDLLAALRDQLEAHPGPIPALLPSLVKTTLGAADTLLRRWVLDLLQFGLVRANLPLETRTTLAGQVLDTLAGLLVDPRPATMKIAIQCFTCVYPMLFRVLCTSRANPQQWEILSICKARIAECVWSQTTTVGVKLAGIKFLQRVILVQTRGVSDPRLQNKNDPNIAMLPSDHPFMNATALEHEATTHIGALFEILFKSQNIDLLTAIFNSWCTIAKQRSGPVQHALIGALTTWTPLALAGLPAANIKSTEKSLRIVLTHLLKSSQASAYKQQIEDTLVAQAQRMERAASEEKARKAAAAAEATRKRAAPTPAPGADAKRQKLNPPANASTTADFLSSFNFATLPAPLVTEIIVANLQAFAEPELQEIVQRYKQSNVVRATEQPAPTPTPTPAPAQPQPVASTSTAPPPTVAAAATPAPAAIPASSAPVKQEPVDPLQMDIDDDDLEFEPDRLNEELSGPPQAAAEPDADAEPDLQLLDFKLPPPRTPNDEERDALIQQSIERIRLNAGETQDVARPRSAAGDVWMLLVVRMITRVAEPPKDAMDVDGEIQGDGTKESGENVGGDGAAEFYQRQDKLRRKLLDYIMADFPARVRLATTWMNEEWYNDRIRSKPGSNWRPNYDTWLNQIVASYQTVLDGKDRTFARFLLDLPALPADVFDLLRDLCVDADRMPVGFAALRDFVIQRPPLREDALKVLLQLTTHPEKVTRNAAIITVKRWAELPPMDEQIREFAIAMLRKLQRSEETMNTEDGQLPPEAVVQTPYLPDRIALPADEAHVLQHVELLFSLSSKVPDFLDEIFAAYGQMGTSVQEAIQRLLTPLIKSLGSSNPKLLTLLRGCPPGAESLVLRVITIFTEHGRPSAQLVALVKSLVNERDLDARFLIPIIAEMDKPDIMKYLPRIVSSLNGEAEPKALVKSVFSSVVTTPPQSFGSVSSNVPRVRQNALLTPAELMVLLHDSVEVIGIKAAKEAIGICFSMTDVYRSEILAVVMQQIVDEPVIPILFLRTVIQAVKTYRSLIGFVSTTLLSRLITKKIWTNPHLWEGFIHCAKAIEPASFGALLQLPKDQLRELVDKQPSLKSSLREFVMKKSGNKARVAGVLDILGEPENGETQTPPPPAPSAPATPTPPPQPEPAPIASPV